MRQEIRKELAVLSFPHRLQKKSVPVLVRGFSDARSHEDNAGTLRGKGLDQIIRMESPDNERGNRLVIDFHFLEASLNHGRISGFGWPFCGSKRCFH